MSTAAVDPRRVRPYATRVEKEPNKTVALVLAVLVGSGGTAATLPKIAPAWYRPDPAAGEELRAIKGDVDRLRVEFHEFLKEGPREVRKNQDHMMQELDSILRELLASPRRRE